MDIAVDRDPEAESLFPSRTVDRSGTHDLQHLLLVLGVQQ
jgi:hypothetical protein